MGTINVNVAKDFSRTPGSRYIKEGDFSGESFIKDFFESIFDEAIASNNSITINLDGTLGYGTSFLEEVFGGLTRKYGKDLVVKTLNFISNEEPYLIDDIMEYIDEAEEQTRGKKK